MPSMNEWLSEKRNRIVSYFAGALFAISWWFFVDAVVYQSVYSAIFPPFNGLYCIPGVVGTVALLLTAFVPVNIISGEDGGLFDDSPSNAIRVFAFIVYGFLFSCIVGSIVIFFQGYAKDGLVDTYPGVALIVQNCLIVASCMLFKFGRTPPEIY